MSLRRLIAPLLTLLVGWIGILSPGAAVAAPVLGPTAHAFGPGLPATDGDAYTERGPPSALALNATYGAVDHWSRGTSTRSDARTPRAITAHDTRALLVQVARATPTRESTQVADVRSIVLDQAGVAAKSVDNILPTPQVGSTKLQHLVDNLYKGTTNPNRVGNGTTMDAIRNEHATGVPTGGRMHSIKGQETLNGLNNWLRRNPGASYSDRLVGQSLADELSLVLRGGG